MRSVSDLAGHCRLVPASAFLLMRHVPQNSAERDALIVCPYPNKEFHVSCTHNPTHRGVEVYSVRSEVLFIGPTLKGT